VPVFDVSAHDPGLRNLPLGPFEPFETSMRAHGWTSAELDLECRRLVERGRLWRLEIAGQSPLWLILLDRDHVQGEGWPIIPIPSDVEPRPFITEYLRAAQAPPEAARPRIVQLPDGRLLHPGLELVRRSEWLREPLFEALDKQGSNPRDRPLLALPIDAQRPRETAQKGGDGVDPTPGKTPTERALDA
jgi:hypothetical protein